MYKTRRAKVYKAYRCHFTDYRRKKEEEYE